LWIDGKKRKDLEAAPNIHAVEATLHKSLERVAEENGNTGPTRVMRQFATFLCRRGAASIRAGHRLTSNFG
jgi:hypothetical protein